MPHSITFASAGLILAAEPLRPRTAGFTDAWSPASQPDGLAITPDGRLMITPRRATCGSPERLAPGTRQHWTSPHLNGIRAGVVGGGGSGLGTNRYVYLFYTFKRSATCPQRPDVTTDNPVNVFPVNPAGHHVITRPRRWCGGHMPSPAGITRWGSTSAAKRSTSRLGDGGATMPEQGCRARTSARDTRADRQDPEDQQGRYSP